MTISAEFIAGGQGEWLLTRWCCQMQLPQLLILFAPFAEEANRSRRVFNQLAHALTPYGYEIWLADFYGTGDAAGDFADIDFLQWQADLAQHLATSRHNYAAVSLLGCRFGALQALDFYQRYPQIIPVKTVCLWQPQLDPAAFWRQLWRQQTTSNQLKHAKAPNPSHALKEGLTIDLAGFAITSHFYNQINALPSVLQPHLDLKLAWFDCSAQPAASQASLQMAGKLKPDSIDPVHLQTIHAPFFWLQQEPVDCSALIDATVNFLTGPRDEHN